MNYFLAPRSREKSYRGNESTIINGVPYEDIAEHLTEEGRSKVLAEPIIYAWGNRSGTRSQWERMNPGDTVIFYSKGEFVMYGEVYFKQHSPGLAEAMWPLDDEGKPWEYTFFIRKIQHILIPIHVFNRMAGYKDRNVVQGFTHFKGEHLRKVEEEYGSLESLLQSFQISTSEEAPKPGDKLYVNVVEVVPSIRTKFFLHPKPIIETRPKTSHPRKVDYEKRARANIAIGGKGEAIVIKSERKRLRDLGRPDLAKKVRRVSKEDDSLGYDVESSELDGAKRYIEVKSTAAKSNKVRFYMSANEMEASRVLPNYYVYYVDGATTKKPRITPIKHPFENKFLITTDTYLLEAEVN